MVHAEHGGRSTTGERYDVLIAGGGNAGLCAAITAARGGARVLVVEGAPRAYRGGNSRHTRNMRVAHDAGNGILTGPYPTEEYLDDLLRVTTGETDERLARLTLEESKSLWDFQVANGVRFQPSLEGTLSLGRTNAFFLGGGKALVNALYQTAGRLGVEARYDTKVVDIDVAEGRFRSATVSTPDGGHADLHAEVFVAASGGFESNLEWLAEYWGPAAENFLIRGTPYNRGEVLRLLMDRCVGVVGDPKQCHAVAIDGRAPVRRRHRDPPRLRALRHRGEPPRRAVLRRGRGLLAEALRHLGPVGGHAARPGRLRDHRRHVVGAVHAVGVPPERADTVGGLAAAMGLDPDKVTDTVQRFNAACRPGTFDHTVHDDCRTEGIDPPKSHWARPIVQPPFYGYSLRPGITFTYLGVQVDAEARMVMADGSRSPNMFAAGEIMAGNVLGKGYLAGIGMTIGSVFGRIAGTEAAKLVGRG